MKQTGDPKPEENFELIETLWNVNDSHCQC